MPENNVVDFPMKGSKEAVGKKRETATGITRVGHARTKNIFVAVSTGAKKRLNDLFVNKEYGPKEDDVAKELAELIEEGSITLMGVDNEN